METPEPNQPPKDAAPKLRIGRIEIGINVIIQLAVLLAMVVMVNSLSAKYYKRWNCVKRNHSDLSPMTRSLLENLQKPIKVIVFFSRMGEVEQDARALLREYEFAAAGKLSIEDVDPEVNFARARELQTKYKFDQKENIIILDYDEELTMKEIGATLDLSESRVSQMHSAIVERLQNQLERRRPEFAM